MVYQAVGDCTVYTFTRKQSSLSENRVKTVFRKISISNIHPKALHRGHELNQKFTAFGMINQEN